MGEIVSPSVPSPEEDKNPFYLGKQCPYVGASALQPAQAQLCASRPSPHQAPGPRPVAPSPSETHAGPPGGLVRHPRGRGWAHGRASPAGLVQAAFCGQRRSCWRQGLPPSRLHRSSGRRAGRTGDINNSHKGEGGERSVLEPGSVSTSRPGGRLKSQPLSAPSARVASGCSLGQTLL